MQSSLFIRNRSTGESERAELVGAVAPSLLSRIYQAFAPLKLKGKVLEPPANQKLLRPEECRDYADDFVYDEQQCRLHFSARRWEEFSLADAAYLLGNLHVMTPQVRYSAIPFMMEVILRSKDWVPAFDDLISRLRDDLREMRIELPPAHQSEMAWAMTGFLEAAALQAEDLGKFESVTLARRTATLWRKLADPSDQQSL